MLLTKLHRPPAGNNIVHRSALFEQLNLGLERKLILISAPAGFGKSMLVSDWSLQHIIPTAWFSIDNGDNDFASFVNYICAAIQTIKKDFGLKTVALLQSPNLPSAESVSALLINEIIEIPKQFLLVLDDFHVIRNPEIVKFTAHFLERLPANIHVVILTRSDPALPLARLRSQQQLVELRALDLGFSANDIHYLFNKKLKLKLSSEEVISLHAKTEGWIAGLQLLALSLQGREDISQFVRDFKGDNRYIMDYLLEEVLKIQTEDVKEFLLQTAVLEQLSAPLCNSLLNRNDSQAILEALEQNNMFIIPLDSERKWYRYHHLFARLLKQRLSVRDKEAVTELHKKAADWFKNNAFPFAAIEHSLEAGNPEKSAAYLGEIIEKMWEGGNHSAIMKYGDLLPADLVKKNATLSLFYSWTLIASGQVQKAAPFLIAAEENVRERLKDPTATEEEVCGDKKLFGKIAVALGYKYTFLGNPEKIFSYCKIAMENLSEDDPLWFSWGWYLTGMAQQAAENILESIEAQKKAMEYGKKAGNNYLITSIAISLAYSETRLGLFKLSHKRCANLLQLLQEQGYSEMLKSEWSFAVLYGNMAAIEYFWADLDNALENIQKAYSLCQTEADVTTKAIVVLVYCLVLHGRGDMAASEMKLKELDEVVKANAVNPNLKAMYVALKGGMLVLLNQPEKARSFFETNGLDPDKKITYADEHGYVAYALLLVSEHKVEQAFTLLARLYEMAAAQNRVERIIEIKIIYAVIYKFTGEKEKAVLNLVQSLEYAADNEIIMNHVNYLALINDLLLEVYKVQKTGKTKIPDSLLRKLKLTIAKREKQAKVIIPENLSSREVDTLQLIALELSNQEIADKLFVSLNTVKTHVKNIYAKLEVDNRKKAIEKGKALQLI
ncbi:LuxR C-terminal-related transcriptional regulator [Adhaeribacter soli]|uniref:HTH luxR-type domain-containing protein n=1 Tax=Adhaeribacter soli TaxID=2607655 RepID=A0A5N1IP11_9BACT|nr:LuxR C-terminal-related transcriptional regulator [Adhaeribacter soli]KAA9325647.1 hypothetical protein F0P94_17070 [Adhaeribacter soli]